MTHKNERVLSVAELARVEGEGALYVRTSGNKVEEARLDIHEPPRFFEAFLRGRAYTEPPDITARTCGICPVAYQMSACLAIEEACGTGVDGPIADLRRLLYGGEWIESHALHIYLLHAPDFLGYSSGIEMATHRRDLVERGLALKKAGNAIMEAVGGRAIHPVNVRLGGFYRAPARAELALLTEPLRRALDTEAPRGTLCHRYEIAADGLIATARIIPPTSQNQAAIEADLRAFVEARIELDDAELTRQCEQAIRNYDPCISCAAHFLDLTVERSS